MLIYSRSGRFRNVPNPRNPMTRRELLAATAAGLAPLRSLRAAPPAKNILLIMSDQHRRDCLGAAGHPVVPRTPNLDALARAGRAFSTAPIARTPCARPRGRRCSPAFTPTTTRPGTTPTPWPFEHKTIAHHFGARGLHDRARSARCTLWMRRRTASITNSTSTNGISTWVRRPSSTPMN